MDRLKLIALDREDIEVVSAHLQDAVVKAADIRWRPAEKRVVIAPDPANKRLGVYEYVVAASRQDKKPPSSGRSRTNGAGPVGNEGASRLTPEERGIGLIRRLGSR